MRTAISALLRRAAVALPAMMLLCVPVCSARGADASGAAEATPDIRVGIAGASKVGRWTRLEVVGESAPAANLRLEVDAPDPDGSAVTYHSEPIVPGSNVNSSPIGLLFKIGRLDGSLRVRVLDGDRLLTNKVLRVGADADADVRAPFRQSVYLVANVQAARDAAAPPLPAGSLDIKRVGKLLTANNESAAAGGSSASRAWTEVVDVDSFAALPIRPDAYDAFDSVLLSERFDLDEPHSRALEQWVRGGGHLLISIGRDGETFAKTASALAAWLPVKVQGSVKLKDLSPVESFCRQSSRIMGANEEPLEAAKLSAPGGQESIPSLAGPLLCRVAYGLGRVTVFGLDLSAAPLTNWTGGPDLAQRLFDLEESQSRRSQTISNRLTQTGVTELATQIDASLDEFPSVSRFTVWHVLGLLVGLVLVVGPIDFLLVHKLLRRPELTWFTFPLLALAAAGAVIYWSAEAKGKRVLLNQLDVLDIDAGTGWSRAHSYALIYSPENRRFNVTAVADPPAAQAPAVAPPKSSLEAAPLRLCWRGRPETTFGGMYRTGGAEISRPSYALSAGCRDVEEMPIAVWSTKSLEAEWSAQKGLVESQLESRGLGHLGGTIRHHFPEPIEDWIVAFGRQVFRPRTDQTERPLPLLPEVPWAPQSASQRELGGYLTGATQSYVETPTGRLEELRTEHADYDPLNRNPLDILRMLTFHGEAGGTLYTGLGNGALRPQDWSPLLDLNRAVLIGRIRKPLTRWKVDGQTVDPDQSYTFVRIVLPVKTTRYRDDG
ncbi:MAG TPA: hypothetical protein VFG04_01025 [Planctomycetaceae bacterium]|nr:hypothetical protein [Planctomycetaceae bacterium]